MTPTDELRVHVGMPEVRVPEVRDRGALRLVPRSLCVAGTHGALL